MAETETLSLEEVANRIIETTPACHLHVLREDSMMNSKVVIGVNIFDVDEQLAPIPAEPGQATTVATQFKNIDYVDVEGTTYGLFVDPLDATPSQTPRFRDLLLYSKKGPTDTRQVPLNERLNAVQTWIQDNVPPASEAETQHDSGWTVDEEPDFYARNP